MMAIATIRLKLTMMDARLKVERPDILAQLRHRGVHHDALRARRQIKYLDGDRRHQQYRAEQQRGDRGIAEQRQARDRRQPRQRRAAEAAAPRPVAS